jgi:hypothetical protein
MTSLPRVTEYTRERVAREFDDLGPAACVAEIAEDLKNNNPELLDIARKCAADVGEPARVMAGFCMFYRLLTTQSMQDLSAPQSGPFLSPLPRVTRATRDRVAAEIDARGAEAFTMHYIDALEQHNPALLQMAHNFASRESNYVGVMEGIALTWAALLAQTSVDRTYLQ